MKKPKPSTSFDIERIPLAMCSARRWLNWRAVERDGKWTKVPCDAARKPVDATDPSYGRTCKECTEAATKDTELGIGFMLGEGWLGVDLDGVVDPASGAITDAQVAEWIASTKSYVETTPSKTGLHVIFKGVEIPAWSQNRRGFVEVYPDKRFFTVTGHALFVDRDAIADQSAVDSLCDRWLRRDKPTPPSPAGATPSGTLDHSATDYALVCDLIRKGTPRDEIEAKLAEKMVSEGRGDKAARADYVPRTIDAAERAVGKDRPQRQSIADRLVAIGLAEFTLGCTTKLEGFAVPKQGANVAIRLNGTEIADRVADIYHHQHKSVPTAGAIEDALAVLRSQARRLAPSDLWLRYALHGDGMVVDLGGVDGRAVLISPAGWKILDRSPVIFKRTALIAALPTPCSEVNIEETLSELQSLLNVGDHFDLLVGWITCGIFPHFEHPVLKLGGGQGAGKSTAARAIMGILDASAAPLRASPKDLHTYSLTVAAAWVTILDNISTIPPWMSDAICRTVSGDAFITRRLYADEDLSVVHFQRVIGMTTIDAGVLRGDLADRVVEIEFKTIEKADRMSPEMLTKKIARLTPKLLGVFYTLVSRVLAELPSIKLDALPRMADFARVLAALDRIRGTRSLQAYIEQGEHLQEDVLEGDTVGSLIKKFMSTQPQGWSGNSESLLERLCGQVDEKQRSQLPKSPRALSGCIRRVIPALRTAGIEVTPPPHTNKKRIWHIARIPNTGDFDPPLRANLVGDGLDTPLAISA